MIIYKDLFTGDELFTDANSYELIEGVIYKVKAKIISEKHGIDESLIGANASAEEAGEGTDDGATTGMDICIANELKETGFASKKEYQAYLKGWCKTLLEKVSAADAEEGAKLKAGLGAAVKELLTGKFENIGFWQGKSMGDEGMIAICKWDEEADIPYLYYFKHGLIPEKV